MSNDENFIAKIHLKRAKFWSTVGSAKYLHEVIVQYLDGVSLLKTKKKKYAEIYNSFVMYLADFNQ